MMKKLVLAAAIVVAFGSNSYAQNAQPVIPLPFSPSGSFSSLTATASSASVALPLGATVVFSNTGTTAVSCTCLLYTSRCV